MADNNSFKQLVQEGAIKPVREEIGQAIEQGVKTVLSGPIQPNPQQTKFSPEEIKKKEEEDKKKIADFQWRVERIKRTEAELKALEQKRQQTEVQEQQEEQQKEQIEQFEIVQEKQKIPEEVKARISAEKKMGRGVAG